MRISTILTTLILIFPLSGETLFNAYQNAESLNGYDKYLILSSDNIYTGGLGIFDGSVFIEGNGAVIDLQSGGGIWVYGDTLSPVTFNIEKCTVINGAYYGINFAGYSTGAVLNCNLINCGMGFQAFDYSVVEVKNCNLVDNEIYGLAIYSTNPQIDISYCNAWNNGEDYMENCPG